ncbi:MAG: FecR family protein, partial [Bacteroidia bacterium]|nr:FecR family protein [Bacteroidia bacterium]
MEKEYLIKKWLANELSVEEQQAFDALDDAPEFHRIMEAAKHFKASNFSTASSFEALEDRIDNRKPVRYLRWAKPLLRLTGVFVVGIGIYFLFFFNNLTQVQTLASEKTTIQLPDASMATLNALSEISYSKNRWDAERKVKLNGEAFFKVAKGKRFDVITSEGIVTVVGTEFNVKQRGDYFEVNCFEGIVRVTA